MSAAEEAFRTALKLQPSFALPHARLATLLRGKLPDEDLAALEARLADEKLEPGVRGRLLFALAHALDGRGDYARAAECLREANELSVVSNEKRRDYAAGRTRAVCRRAVARVRSRPVRAAGRRRLAQPAAGFRLRPASLGHDVDRASPGQPFPGLRGGRIACWPGARSRRFPACWAAADRPARLHPLPRSARRSTAWPRCISSA